MMNINTTFLKNYLKEFNRVNNKNYSSVLMTQQQTKYSSAGISYFNNQKKSMLETLSLYVKERYHILKDNTNAMGINVWDILKTKVHYHAPVLSLSSISSRIKNIETLSDNVLIKERKNNRNITAKIDKINFESGNSIIYVLKRKDKQLGFIDITSLGNNELYINYLTNVLGRKKYRNIENILIQAVAEDCLRNGFIPSFRADAINVGNNMGRLYNNTALYKRMGMEQICCSMIIDSAKVKELVTTKIHKFGEILSGSSKYLEK